MTDLTISPARQQYDADGFFLHRDPLFPPDLVARAVEGMDAVRLGQYDTGREPQPSHWTPGDDLSKLCKIEQPQFASHALRELISYPALGALAAELTGASRVQVFWVQLLLKPSTLPGAPPATNIGWHQDRSYWGTWEEGSELFTAWIALSDVTERSGAMRFVPGSHRWGLRAESDFWAQDLADQRGGMALKPGETWSEMPAILSPGGVSFHDDFTLHASGPNTSGAPRRSLAVHLRTERSRAVDDKRTGLAAFIDDLDLCPVLFGR